MKSRLIAISLGLAVGGSIAWPTGAHAEDLRKQVMIEGRVPDVTEIENILFPTEIKTEHQKCAKLEAAGLPCQSVIPKASLETTMVTFDRGSANLTEASKSFLDRVAAALKNKQDYRAKVVIEGHTDATGSNTINQNLSRKRAEAVKSYLSSKHGIANVDAIGRASESLKDPKNPGAAVNRRIEFVVTLPGQG